MLSIRQVFATFLLVVMAAPAHAAYVVYTNETDYLAAVGATRAYTDFAGSPGTTVGGASFLSEVVFGSCTDAASAFTCGTEVLHSSDAITDVGGSSAPNGVGSLAWRFTAPDVYAFGFNYVSGAIDALNIVGFDLGLTPIDTTAASGFIGLVSDAALYGVIGVNAVFPGNIGNDRYFLDDFRINAPAPVPEPGTLGLLGAALVAAAMATRRRRARALRELAA